LAQILVICGIWGEVVDLGNNGQGIRMVFPEKFGTDNPLIDFA